MTTLEKLNKIIEQKCIYNIMFRNAGVGFQFYYPEKDNGNLMDGSWKQAIEVERYYNTFEEAVDMEYEKLNALR